MSVVSMLPGAWHLLRSGEALNREIDEQSDHLEPAVAVTGRGGTLLQGTPCVVSNDRSAGEEVDLRSPSLENKGGAGTGETSC